MTPAGVPGTPAGDPAAEGVRRLAEGFASAGWSVAPGEPGAPWSFVAYKAEFRMRWMATRLHTFVFGMPIYDGVHVPWLNAQLAAAAEFSRRNKPGLPPGFQTGSAAVLVGVGSELSPAVLPWAAQVHGQQFGVMTFPVLGDVSNGIVIEPVRPFVGVVYYGHLRGIVSRFVRPAIGKPWGVPGA